MTEEQTDGSKTTPRLGFLYPSHSAEDDYPRMGTYVSPAVEVKVVHTTIKEDAHREDAIRHTGDLERLLVGARKLQEKQVDVAMWACTCASFVFGWGGANQQAREVQERLGVPVSSTSLAFVAALKALAVGKVAIAGTYPEDVVHLFRDFLAEVRIETVHMGGLGIITGVEVSDLPKEEVIRLVQENDHPEAEAILVPDTALHSAGWIEDLETAVGGKLVLTANQVTMWQALSLLDDFEFTMQPGLGSLFG